MATMAAVGGIAGLGGVKLHPIHSKTPSPFLGKKLKIRTSSEWPPHTEGTVLNPKTCLVYAVGGELVDMVNHLFVGVGVGLPCTVMECGDIIYRSTLPRSNGLTLTAPGVVLALGALSYLWATPGVAPGFFDMFVLAFVERLFRTTYRKDDFVLGKKLGEGAFGVVYKVSLDKPSSKMVDAWGGWSLFQALLRTLKQIASKHGVSIPAVAVKYILNQPSVAGSMIGVRLGLSEHIKDSNAVLSLNLDEEDINSIQEVSKKGKDLLKVIGDCGDEYRRA